MHGSVFFRTLLHSQRFLFMVRMIFMTHFSHQSFLCFLHPFLSHPISSLSALSGLGQYPNPEGSPHGCFLRTAWYLFLPSLFNIVAYIRLSPILFLSSPSIAIASGDKFPGCRMQVVVVVVIVLVLHQSISLSRLEHLISVVLMTDRTGAIRAKCWGIPSFRFLCLLNYVHKYTRIKNACQPHAGAAPTPYRWD